MLLDNETERQDRQVFVDIFGDSDVESDTEVLPASSWKKIEKISGLWLCKYFLAEQQQEDLISAINAEGWFEDRNHNQAMKFKDLPTWALELSKLIFDAVSSYALANDTVCPSSSSQKTARDMPLNVDLLQRVPLFDQIIINRYQPGEGICAHVDLLQFEDGIAVISLESTCVMHFTHCFPKDSLQSECPFEEPAGHTYADNKLHPSEIHGKVPILLEPGDLVLLSGDARYNWTHEINRNKNWQTWQGDTIYQMQRTSVTLRKLVMPKGGSLMSVPLV